MRYAALACILPFVASSALAIEAKQELHCVTGPVTKTYGGTQWLVHGCTDGKSLVFTAVNGSPAAPFEFDLTYTGDGYDLDGKGSGNKTVAGAAYTDLQRLKAADVQALLKEVEAVESKR